MSAPSDTLRNLGPVSRRWLAAIGIHKRHDLETTGINHACLLLRQHQYPVTPNLLYAMAGALHDCDWRHLPIEIKQELQLFARQQKSR